MIWMRCMFAVLLGVGASAHGEMVEFEEFETFDGWADQAGDFTTLDFTGFEDFELITDQYSEDGVVFEGSVAANYFPSLYLEDGWGLLSANEVIDIRFDSPVRSVASYFPGFIDFRFFAGDEMVLETKNFYGGPGAGNFVGLTLDRAFDRVVMIDTVGFVSIEIDDFYFSPIPAPGALAALVTPLLVGRRRRRGR